MRSTGSLLILVQMGGIFGKELWICEKSIFRWILACKHNKSRMPSPIKSKFVVYLSHEEYRKPIDFGADGGSFLGKNWEFVRSQYSDEFWLVNTIRSECSARSNRNLVCSFLMRGTGSLLILVQMVNVVVIFGKKMGICEKSIFRWILACKHDKYRMLSPIKSKFDFGAFLRKNWEFMKIWYFNQFWLVNTICPSHLDGWSSYLVCVFPMMSTWFLLFWGWVRGHLRSLEVKVWHPCKHDKSRMLSLM